MAKEHGSLNNLMMVRCRPDLVRTCGKGGEDCREACWREKSEAQMLECFLQHHTRRIPQVGDGATIVMWTDRHAATVIEVSESGKTIKIQEDKAIRTDDHGMSDSQSYRFEPDPNGVIRTVRLCQNGWKITNGSRVLVGVRDHYYDYSF